jgi:hypothetical protein
MSDNRPKNFQFCELSLYLANKSLLEISNILYFKSNDLNPISRSDTFKFYLFTLHYTFILEFTKLMEKEDEKRKGNHFASLQKINKKIYNIKGKNYKDSFQNNLSKLESIWRLPIFEKILILRDSKIIVKKLNHLILTIFQVKKLKIYLKLSNILRLF